MATYSSLQTFIFIVQIVNNINEKIFFLVGGLTFFYVIDNFVCQNQNSTQSYDPIFKIVEEMPMILECYGSGTEKEMQNCSDSKLATFIAENLEYPEQAKLNKTKGKKKKKSRNSICCK